MPMKPNKPMLKSICKNCGWTDVTPQRSDVMLAPTICKKCGGVSFDRQQQSVFTAFITNPLAVLVRLNDK